MVRTETEHIIDKQREPKSLNGSVGRCSPAAQNARRESIPFKKRLLLGNKTDKVVSKLDILEALKPLESLERQQRRIYD